MLVACRLAGLSALGTHYAGVVTLRQSGATSSGKSARLDSVSSGATSEDQAQNVVRLRLGYSGEIPGFFHRSPQHRLDLRPRLVERPLRLPTAAEGEIIRDKLGIGKKRVLSDAELERLKAMGAEHGFRPRQSAVDGVLPTVEDDPGNPPAPDSHPKGEGDANDAEDGET
jgi:hypothetical protein